MLSRLQCLHRCLQLCVEQTVCVRGIPATAAATLCPSTEVQVAVVDTADAVVVDAAATIAVVAMAASVSHIVSQSWLKLHFLAGVKGAALGDEIRPNLHQCPVTYWLDNINKMRSK